MKRKNTYSTTGNTLSNTNYQYNSTNELTSVSGIAYAYDKNGNLIDDGEKLYTWGTGGRLTEVKNKATGA